MGMFDEYIPDPPLPCPACDAVLDGWQGKDGPNALMVWRQGQAAPVDQAIEDEEIRLAPEQLAAFRLPEQFLIYTQCCGARRFFLEAACHAPGGIWSSTLLETAETAIQGKQERRGDFKARMRWLGGKSN